MRVRVCVCLFVRASVHDAGCVGVQTVAAVRRTDSESLEPSELYGMLGRRLVEVDSLVRCARVLCCVPG